MPGWTKARQCIPWYTVFTRVDFVFRGYQVRMLCQLSGLLSRVKGENRKKPD